MPLVPVLFGALRSVFAALIAAARFAFFSACHNSVRPFRVSWIALSFFLRHRCLSVAQRTCTANVLEFIRLGFEFHLVITFFQVA